MANSWLSSLLRPVYENTGPREVAIRSNTIVVTYWPYFSRCNFCPREGPLPQVSAAGLVKENSHYIALPLGIQNWCLGYSHQSVFSLFELLGFQTSILPLCIHLLFKPQHSHLSAWAGFRTGPETANVPSSSWCHAFWDLTALDPVN